MPAETQTKPNILGKDADALKGRLQEQLQRLMTVKHVKHAIAAVESMDSSFKWVGAVGEVIGHTGASGSWLFYCPPLDILLTGSVSQIAATAAPFQAVPKMLNVLKPYFS